MPVADALLTALLQSVPAGLYLSRDCRADVVVCVLWSNGKLGRELCQLPADRLRGLLARFGHHYMSGQLYGGDQLLVLEQCGSLYNVWLRTGNEQRVGYWLQATAQPLHTVQPGLQNEDGLRPGVA